MTNPQADTLPAAGEDEDAVARDGAAPEAVAPDGDVAGEADALPTADEDEDAAAHDGAVPEAAAPDADAAGEADALSAAGQGEDARDGAVPEAVTPDGDAAGEAGTLPAVGEDEDAAAHDGAAPEAAAPDGAATAERSEDDPPAEEPDTAGAPAVEPATGASDGAVVALAGEPDAAAEPIDPEILAAAVRLAEALVFASDRPVTPHMLAAVLPEGVAAAPVMAALAEAFEGRGVVLTEVAGGWAFRTAPDLAPRLTKVVQAPRRLPRAAMEALSVVAYHQPCTRGEIEEIRGAALAQTTLEVLLELGLIAPRGRREVPGRPTLWGTTPKFLEQFGLKALSDLPRKEELVTAETGPALPGMVPDP